MGGTLVIDLNGHTLSSGTSDHLLNGIGKRYNSSNKMCDTNIIFENGNISMDKKVLTTFGIWTQYYTTEKTFNYTFNNVNFGFNTASASVLIAGSANNKIDTDDTKNATYLRQLVMDLKNTLKAVGAEAVLCHETPCYRVDTNLLRCDYFSYLETGKPEFHGEYMTQYSWAEETCAMLLFKK